MYFSPFNFIMTFENQSDTPLQPVILIRKTSNNLLCLETRLLSCVEKNLKFTFLKHH